MPPGERHDLALKAFGIALDRTGGQIVYLGADTPVAELTRAALARTVPLILAGAGATPALGAAIGARLPDGDPVTAAEQTQWPR